MTGAVSDGFALATASPAFAHHEAMFRPQSSAVLSPGIFLSALAFDKETGRGDLQAVRQHERLRATIAALGGDLFHGFGLATKLQEFSLAPNGR